jgi:hypothetical protein
LKGGENLEKTINDKKKKELIELILNKTVNGESCIEGHQDTGKVLSCNNSTESTVKKLPWPSY